MENKKINWKRFWVRPRKVLNISWKVALVFIGILSAFILYRVAQDIYAEHYGKYAHTWDKRLSERICVHYIHRKGVKVYDLQAEKYVTPILAWVSATPERDSLAVFCGKDGKRGFINANTGEIVIEGKYEHAWVFSEGLAAVVEPDGKMGFIDHTGKYVIAPELDYFDSHDYVFKHDVCCIADRDGKQGLLSRDGKWVLPQEYSWIDYVAETDMFIPTKDEKDGLIKNGSFEWVYPVEYDDISWTDAPTGHGFILYKDFRSQHVSVDGKVIDSFLIDGTEELRYMVKCDPVDCDEYAISNKVMAFCVYGLWGVMDKSTGKVIIPAKYGRIEMASKDIVQCGLEKYGNNDYVLYDLKGRKIE